eukprot:4232991-Pyramimonas_sp.AAC.1
MVVSVTAGQQGLAHYSGANYFLDAAARVMHASGRPALSVDFGLFSSVGMAASDAGATFKNAQTAFRALGLGALKPADALAG